MDLQEDKTEDKTTEYVCIMPHSWGASVNEISAIQNALRNYHDYGSGDTVKIAVYKVEGEYEISEMGSIRAEKFLQEREFEVDLESLKVLNKANEQVELFIDELLGDGEIEDVKSGKISEDNFTGVM